jgi:hypothetical protein
MSRNLTPEESRKLIRDITGGWKNLAGDALRAVDNFGGFIASEEEVTPPAQLLRTLNRFSCRVWARLPKGGFTQSANAFSENICAEYLESLDENPEPGSIQAGDTLLGSGRGTYTADDGYWIGLGGTPDTEFSDNFQGTVVVQAHCSSSPGAAYSMFVVNGQSFPPGDNFYGTGCPSYALKEVRVFSRAQSPGYTPPTSIVGSPLPPTIEVNVPGVGPIDVSVGFDDEGRPVVCIPELEVCATVDVDGIFGGDTFNPGLIQRPPGDVGQADTPETTGAGGESEGEAPEGSVISGLQIEILSQPVTASKFTPDVYRAVCYIYMGVPDNLALHFDGSLMTDNQFVLPQKDNLTNWKVVANSGYNLRVTPFYYEIEEQTTE